MNRYELTTDWLEHFIKSPELPSPALQAANLIRIIGNHVVATGEGYCVDSVRDTAIIGSFNKPFFKQIAGELMVRGTVVSFDKLRPDNPLHRQVADGFSYGLSLDGWGIYEAERRGQVAGRYGFLAMKFGDPVLDAFAENTIKPSIREALNYAVVDLRNVARAGIIDNIMRGQIRDAAFVLVDLTHDNAGAYWEAGYAEGLGKPVIYLCERGKFDSAKTHFDTNHCTTVIWAPSEATRLSLELVATLRRSLNLFSA